MKKVVSFLAVAAVVVIMSSAVFADPFKVLPAVATFEGNVTLDVNIYDYESGKDFSTYEGVGVSSITFNVSSVTFASETGQWANANQIIKVHSNLTTQEAGKTIYLYTDNANATGDYKANASRQDGNNTLYSGLVRKGNTYTYVEGDFAPIKIAIRKITDANNEFKSALPNFSETHYYTQGFRHLNDKSDSNFGDLGAEEKVLGISGSAGGFWVGKNDQGAGEQWYAGSEDAIIFLGAEFIKVLGGNSYGTTTIKFAETIE